MCRRSALSELRMGSVARFWGSSANLMGYWGFAFAIPHAVAHSKVSPETEGTRLGGRSVGDRFARTSLNSFLHRAGRAMPIAPPIPGVWPPSLFDDAGADRSSSAWCAFHVRPRSEKVVSRRLKEDGSVGYFLPLSTQKRRYQRRQVEVQYLLFPGYVFVHGDRDAIRHCRFTVPGVVNCLEEPDQSSLHESLSTIRALLESGASVSPEERLEPGMAVEIIGGPLAGQCGVVIENKKALRFLIQLNFIQQGVSVAVDASVVRAL